MLNTKVEIDVWAKELEGCKVVYRALVALSRTQSRNKLLLKEVNASFTRQQLKIHLAAASDPAQLASQLSSLTTHNVNTGEYLAERYDPISYKELFEKHLVQ